jgi:uncharacterized phage-associated protein
MKYDAKEIAKYIITRCQKNNNPISNLQLQKMLYFLWIDYYRETEERLFEDIICAWQWGPVVRDVYFEYCSRAADKIYEEYDTDLNPELRRFLDDKILRYAKENPFNLVNKSQLPGLPWERLYGKNKLNEIPFEDIEEYALNGGGYFD